MSIYIDITELASNPIRSGVQRIVREFIARARRVDGYTCCVFDPAALNLITIDEEAVEILTERNPIYQGMSVGEVRDRVAELMRSKPGTLLPDRGIKIFIPEVFFEINRVRHYRWRLKQSPDLIYILFCDFIPWLHPEHIGVRQGAPLMPYIQLSMEVQHAAFISDLSHQHWRTRILRDEAREARVFRLGSDGLRLEKQSFHSDKKSVVCLGSLDGRKNQDVICRSFIKAWEDGCDLRLVVIGYAFDKTSDVYRTVRASAEICPNLEYIEAAPDTLIPLELRRARATIYGSTIEGFGLPPVESLYAGIPAIVARGLPSTQLLPSAGQIRLEAIDELHIAAALRVIADDESALRLWGECQTLNLPTWKSFVEDVKVWLEA